MISPDSACESNQNDSDYYSSNILACTPLHNVTLLLFPLNHGVYFSTLSLSWPHDLLGPTKFHRRNVLGFGRLPCIG